MAASDPLPVVVVGAGVCGLSAAAGLREAGHPVLLLEAGERIGGRARTLHPAILGGRSFDAGASWLHAIEHNPLADLARAAGAALEPAHRERHHLLIDGREAGAAEQRAAERADTTWRRFAAERAADPGRPDISLSALGSEWGADDPFLPNLELWEGAIIAAADAESLSARDWHRNQLSGDDLLPSTGLGTLASTLLGPAAGPVTLRTPVLGIDSLRADRLDIHTAAGTIAAAACIVTVSTGVLRAESIRFRPGLPAPMLAALDGLPMGLLSKLACSAPGAEWIDPVDGDLWEERLAHRGEPGMLLSAAPATAEGAPPLLTGWLGGRFAWELAARPAEALAELRARVARCCGARAAADLAPDGVATGWGTDPLFRGAYAYARPGHDGARAVLGQPFAGNRIVFAGEACRTDGLAGTVGGAYADGRRAARAVRDALIVA